MASQTLNTIKNWFKTGLKPTQTQFWDTWDSFRHKYEKVPVKDVDGLDELLLSKAEKTVLDEHLADKNAHAPQVNTDWNSNSGFSQLLNKPEFKTINGKKIVGNGDIAIKEGGSQNLQETLNNGSSAGFDGTSTIKLLDGEPFQKVVSWDFLNDAQESHFLGNLETFSSNIKNGNRKTSIQQQSNELTFSKTQDTEDGTFQNTLDLGMPTSNSKFTLPSKEVDGNYTLATTDEIIGENGLTLQKVLENGSEGIIPNGVKIGHNATDDSTWSTLNLKDGNGIDLYSSGAFNLATKGFYLNSTTGGGFVTSGNPSQNEPLRINSQSSGMELAGGAGGVVIQGQGKEVKLSGADYGDGGVQMLSRLGVGRVKNITGSNLEIFSDDELNLNSSKKTSLSFNNGAASIFLAYNGRDPHLDLNSNKGIGMRAENGKINIWAGAELGQGVTVNNKNVVRTINGLEADVSGNVVLPINEVLPVSATQSGIVDNTPLQELGGVDKYINGIRIGRGNNSTSTSNTVLGAEALISSLDTALGNTAIGEYTLSSATTGDYNTAVGASSLGFLTTGTQNVGIGGAAGLGITTGNFNLAIGTNALLSLKTGETNVAIGAVAGYSITGNANTALGFFSNGNKTEPSTGEYNTTLGFQSGYTLTTGTKNTIIESPRQTTVTTGSGNVILNRGDNATGITTGNNNTILGGVNGLNGNDSNLVVLADGSGIVALRKEADNRLLAPTLTNALIDADNTGKSIVTKEWVNTKIIKTTSKKEYVAKIRPSDNIVTIYQDDIGSITIERASPYFYFVTSPNFVGRPKITVDVSLDSNTDLTDNRRIDYKTNNNNEGQIVLLMLENNVLKAYSQERSIDISLKITIYN